MAKRLRASGFVLLLVSIGGTLSAQQSLPWRDPSPHTVQFVTVDDNVKLEVLDWGGSGRPLVLLAGIGATAHIYDDFAPKLTDAYHVFGITRRGFGASSAPVPANANYAADRLGDDVLAVLDALKLDRPVLVGHSMGGEELSSVGSTHPERVAALIYLDAGYSYAYYDRLHGDLNIDLQELQRKLDQLQPGKRPPDPTPLVQELLQTTLPAFERDLHQSPDIVPLPKSSSPTAADRESFPTALAWQKRVYGYSIPEAELRQEVESTPEGHVGANRGNPGVRQAIISGEQKYTDLHLPILAIFAIPHDFGSALDANDPIAAAFLAADKASTEAQVNAFESGVPSAHVVRLAHANHTIFISNETDVLREMRTFLADLH
jgi:pimeloyl-ACP methyl ester carboxylesterase